MRRGSAFLTGARRPRRATAQPTGQRQQVHQVLAERSDQVVDLIANTNALLAQLQTPKRGPGRRFRATSPLWSRATVGLHRREPRADTNPALDKLNGVLTIVDNRKERVQKSLKLLNTYALSLGESLSAGPFFNAYIANLLPGQFMQPFVDAAFSDLGLDPEHVVAVAAHRPADRSAGYPAAAGALSPHRPGRRAALGHCPTPSPATRATPATPTGAPLPAPPPGGPPPGPPAPAPPG